MLDLTPAKLATFPSAPVTLLLSGKTFVKWRVFALLAYLPNKDGGHGAQYYTMLKHPHVNITIENVTGYY